MQRCAADAVSEGFEGDVIRERVAIAAARGEFAGELAYPARGAPRFSALLAGPHPYMGGTMRHPLICAIADDLALRGGVTLRFDYGDSRGIDVAASMARFWETGHAPEDAGRLDAAADAAAFLSRCTPQAAGRLVLLGYSFGCHVVWRLWLDRVVSPHAIAAVVLVSPTLTRHEFTLPDANPDGDPPILVIHSADDFATPLSVVTDWLDSAKHRLDDVEDARRSHTDQRSPLRATELDTAQPSRGAVAGTDRLALREGVTVPPKNYSHACARATPEPPTRCNPGADRRPEGTPGVTLAARPAGNHFFRGDEAEIAAIAGDFVTRACTAGAGPEAAS